MPAPPPKTRVRELREQRPGHAEHHGVDVDHEGALQRLAPLQVAQPLGDGLHAGTRAAALRLHRPHEEDRQPAHAEGDDVTPVGGRQRDLGDHQARDGGTDHQRGLPQDLLQGERRGELVGPDQRRHRRAPRRRVDAGQARRDGGQHVERPQLRRAAHGVQRQGGTRERHEHLRGQQQLAAVEGVGQRATEQRADEQRAELGDAEHADRERRVRDRVDLHGHGHDRELGPDERDELPAPEQPVVARVAQGRDVDEDPATPTAGGRGQPGSWASIAAMTSGASGSTWGAKRSTTSPVGEMRNFSKFQRMSPAVPSASAWVVSSA